MPVAIEVAVAKTHKFATRESGDSAEVVERPGGGLSLVVVDGQGSGAAAKRLSLMVAGKVIALLSEGVRDDAVAQAASDYLFAQRGGRVSCALDIVSVDLPSRTLSLTRNSEVPMLVYWPDGSVEDVESGSRIGIRVGTEPCVLRYPAEPGWVAVLATDGVVCAGRRFGSAPGLAGLARELDSAGSASELADTLLRRAIEADQGFPQDDMTVAVIKLGPPTPEQPVRRLAISVPIQG